MQTPYNKLLIFYFSGTGNALAASKWLSKQAEDHAIEIKLINVAEKVDMDALKIDKNTLIGFCYPTHGFNAPPIIIKFIRKLPKAGKKVNFFILNTRAGMKAHKIFTPGISGLAFLLPMVVLSIKGYKAVGYRPLDLPSNWISVHPGLKEKVVKSIFKRCERITSIFATKIFHGKKSFNRMYELPIDVLVIPISFAYYFIGRFLLSKTFIPINEMCNSCGLCEKECPVNAIIMKSGLPFWTYKCESCMHCMNICPQKAIQTPHVFTIIVWWIAMGVIPLYFHFILPDSISISSPIYKFLEIFEVFFFVFITYKLLHMLLLKSKYANTIIKYTSLTNYKFWRRYRAVK